MFIAFIQGKVCFCSYDSMGSAPPHSACGWRAIDIDKFLVLQVAEYWKKYPLSPDGVRDETVAASRNRKENEENLLILFRKFSVRYRANDQ